MISLSLLNTLHGKNVGCRVFLSLSMRKSQNGYRHSFKFDLRISFLRDSALDLNIVIERWPPHVAEMQ